MINGIKSWVDTQTETDRISITIGDGEGALKSIEITPKDAFELGRELIAAAYQAKGANITNVIIGAY